MRVKKLYGEKPEFQFSNSETDREYQNVVEPLKRDILELVRSKPLITRSRILITLMRKYSNTDFISKAILELEKYDKEIVNQTQLMEKAESTEERDRQYMVSRK
jgi:hypothetical protein